MTQVDKITNELIVRGISQKDFCEAIKIKQNTLSTWKARGGNVPNRNITAICNYFGWPVNEFLDYEIERNIDIPDVDSSLAENFAIQMIKSLPKEDRNEITELILSKVKKCVIQYTESE